MGHIVQLVASCSKCIFAKTREKPYKKSIFKHFGLSVPNLRQLNPARIRLRVTQKLTLRGEPVLMKKSLLG